VDTTKHQSKQFIILLYYITSGQHAHDKLLHKLVAVLLRCKDCKHTGTHAGRYHIYFATCVEHRHHRHQKQQHIAWSGHDKRQQSSHHPPVQALTLLFMSFIRLLVTMRMTFKRRLPGQMSLMSRYTMRRQGAGLSPETTWLLQRRHPEASLQHHPETGTAICANCLCMIPVSSQISKAAILFCCCASGQLVLLLGEGIPATSLTDPCDLPFTTVLPCCCIMQ